MEIKTTVTAIIAAVVALVIVVAVAVPIISDLANESTATYNDAIKYTATDKDLNLTIVNDSEEYFLINGEKFTKGGCSIGSDRFVATYTESTDEFRVFDCGLGRSILATQMTITNGAYTIINNEGTTLTSTTPITTLIHPSNNGNLGAFVGDFNIDYGASAYVCIAGNTSATDYIILFSEIKNGVPNDTICYTWDGSAYNAYDTTLTTYYEEYPDYINQKTKITYTLDDGDHNFNSAIMYGPTTYHTDEGLNGAMKSIIEIIPLLMIVGIIIAITAIFIRTR